MNELSKDILNDSNRILTKLQLLSAFFQDEIIYKIYLRSQIIHKLFEANDELDINQLSLFHTQFTTSAIDLLKQIKKNNELNVSVLLDEIQLNKELISNLSDSIFTEKNYNNDKQRQSLKINLSLRNLFKVLSDNSTEYPFSKSINSFSARYAQDFFYDISLDIFAGLINFDPKDVYNNAYATIQKKLMGTLCKYDFKTEFLFGIKDGALIAEIYKFIDIDKFFLFLPSKNLLLFCDMNALNGIDWTNSISKNAKIVQELNNKSDRLQSSIQSIKTNLPNDIKNLLNDHLKKISDIDFIRKITNVDVQANILRAMLNTDGI